MHFFLRSNVAFFWGARYFFQRSNVSFSKEIQRKSQQNRPQLQVEGVTDVVGEDGGVTDGGCQRRKVSKIGVWCWRLVLGVEDWCWVLKIISQISGERRSKTGAGCPGIGCHWVLGVRHQSQGVRHFILGVWHFNIMRHNKMGIGCPHVGCQHVGCQTPIMYRYLT